MWKPHFENQSDFVKEVTRNFDIADDKIRIGVTTYSDRPITIVHLSDRQTLQDIHRALDKTPYITGGTDTPYVIRHARTEGFAQARPYVARIIVLITDGKSTVFQDIRKEVKKTRRSGVGVFIVGVGEEAKMADLMKLSDGFDQEHSVFHMPDFKIGSRLAGLLAERTCKTSALLTSSPPPEKCPSTPSDVIFVYDSAALSRHHNNAVIRLITAVTSSHHINNRGALRVGVIRDVDASANDIPRSESVVSDIELTDQWTRKSDFRRRLDPGSKRAVLNVLLRKVRRNHFPRDSWYLQEDQKRKRFIVMFVDSPVFAKHAAKVEARRLRKSGVTISVVAIGENYGNREIQSLVSLPTDSHIIRSQGKGLTNLSRAVQEIINVLCR